MGTKKLSSWQLLEAIKENPGATAPQLKKILAVDLSSTNYHFHLLMKKGFIRREKDYTVPPYSPHFRYYANEK